MPLPEIPLWIKFTIAIIWDLLDLTIFRLPIFWSFIDLIGGFLAIFLWGPEGILAFWEIIDVTDQADAFIPTLTMIGVISWLRNRGHDTGEIAGNISAVKRGIR